VTLAVTRREGKRVRIIGDHPHKGATGTVRDDLPMLHGMWKVELDNSHADACYAGRGNLIPLRPSEDPWA
jgi:hypothetical protein